MAQLVKRSQNLCKGREWWHAATVSEGGDRDIPVVHWPACLAESVSLALSEKLFQKIS